MKCSVTLYSSLFLVILHVLTWSNNYLGTFLRNSRGGSLKMCILSHFDEYGITRPRQPSKYVRVFSFLCTLSEHPGLHLPRRLLAVFSTGCQTLFIARHPRLLGFREDSAVHSALVILDYIEIKHYFFSV